MANRAVHVALFWHSGAGSNLGVGALTWSNIRLLGRAAEAAEIPLHITMYVSGEPRLDRLDPLPVAVDVKQVTIPSRPSWMPSAFRVLHRELAKQDVVMDIGAGDSFASIYGRGPFARQLFTKAAATVSRASYVLAPQTLGPFTRSAGVAAHLAMAPADLVFCRDHRSAEFARRARRSGVWEIADVAFALEPVPCTLAPSTTSRVGFNVSGLLYHADPHERYAVPGYRSFVERAIRRLVDRPDTEVHLIPHVVDPGGSALDEDYELAVQLAAHHPELVLPEPFQTAGQAKGYIGELDVLLTSRMHAAIAAIGTGTAAIAVSYSPKFQDTLRFVGYEVPTIDLTDVSESEALAALDEHLERIPSLTESAAAAAANANVSLDRYVGVLADHFRSRVRDERGGEARDAITEVVDGGLCIGCGACTVLARPGAVTMSRSANGFLEPVVHDTDAVREIRRPFAQVCPGVHVSGSDQPRTSVLWGPVRGASIGHSADERQRFDASSGGVLSALCSHLLRSGRVDAVLTLSPDPEDPLHPKGRVARSVAELEGTGGSRYCPSSPVALLSQLRPDERAAFVGKPCDIAAVRELAHQLDWVDRQVVVLLSFFCAGIPNFNATETLVRSLGHEPREVTAFRYRGAGWPGRATSRHGDDERSMSYDESWGTILAGQRHERCKICPDATGELADVACADGWHTVDGQPVFDEAPGRSVVLSRTRNGESLVEGAHTEGAIHLAPLDLERVETMQPFQAIRKRSLAARLIGRRLMGAPVPRLANLGLLRAAGSLGLRASIREAKGSALRARRDHPRRWHRYVRRPSRKLD